MMSNQAIAICLLSFFAVSCFATTTTSSEGCLAATPTVPDSGFTIETTEYPDSQHRSYKVTIAVTAMLTSYSVDVCFDTTQCITSAWNCELYTYAAAAGNCYTLVSTNDATMQAGEVIELRFETYGVAVSTISSITLNGNGVVEVVNPPSTPPLPSAHCATCDGGYVTDQADCGFYYHCSNGTPYHMPCPGGLYFNQAKQVCDWPGNAGCSSPSVSGRRRVQCRDADANCPAGSLYSESRLVSGCGAV